MTEQSENGGNFVTVEEAKQQLAIDEGLTIHDARIKRLIGAAIDMAQNYTQRSLGELLELDSPSDSSALPLPDPKDSPSLNGYINLLLDADPSIDYSQWSPGQWHAYWAANPIMMDQAQPLRRDVKEAILLFVECLFDRNIDNIPILKQMGYDMLQPYRIAMGV